MSSPSVQPDPVHGAVCFILLVTFALILFIGTMCLLVALVYLLQLAVTAPEDDEAQADLEIGKPEYSAMDEGIIGKVSLAQDPCKALRESLPRLQIAPVVQSIRSATSKVSCATSFNQGRIAL